MTVAVLSSSSSGSNSSSNIVVAVVAVAAVAIAAAEQLGQTPRRFTTIARHSIPPIGSIVVPFLGLLYGILNINHKKELQRSL